MKRILFLLFLCVAVHSLSAQRGIGTNSPDPSAALDLTSTTQGFLPPRMTFAQMTAIVSPTAGLTVYCTDCEPVGVHYYDGSFFLNTRTGNISGNLTTLDDASVTYTGISTLDFGVAYTSSDGLTASIPYTGWGGNAHNPIAFNSTNAWGLKATLDPASLNASAGNAIFNITGTVVEGGATPILFNINLGGKIATVSWMLNSGFVPFGPAEVILDTQSTGSGFETFNAANIDFYNGTQSYGVASVLFNGAYEAGGFSFHLDRDTAGIDWGIGYTFDNPYYFTGIKASSRSDGAEGRASGGEFRVYLNGVLVATSPTVIVPNTTSYSPVFSPNVVGDEVRYIFPNGISTNLDAVLNFSELDIAGQQVN